MSNLNAANGFTPLRHLTGGVIRANEYPIANAQTGSMAAGDIVALNASGTVIRGTAGGVALGVFYGVEYIATDGSVKFEKVWTSGTVTEQGVVAKAYVYDDPNITYKVQTNGTFVSTAVGALANVTLGTFNSTYGHSTDELDFATLATTSKVLRILRLIDYPNNTVGADAKLEVVINLSLYGTQNAGV